MFWLALCGIVTSIFMIIYRKKYTQMRRSFYENRLAIKLSDYWWRYQEAMALICGILVVVGFIIICLLSFKR
jgi:hypothetical protein